MVEVLDSIWLVLVLLGLAAVLVGMRYMPVVPDHDHAREDGEADDCEPEPNTLGDWRNEHEEREVPPGGMGWAECLCCGCPALDTATDFPECEVCGWEGDVDGVDAARMNFSLYGSAHEPPELVARGRRTVSPRERAAALDVVAVCSAVEPGERPIASFWRVFYDKLDALRRAREEAAS